MLSPMDPLRSSRDEFGLSSSSSSTPTDYRAKYEEAADMLAEARNELDDFVHSSKELEEELLRELERTEKTQKDLKDRISRVESDRDDWKNKFISLQTTHNTSVNTLHRELDTLRKEHQTLKIQFRDLEVGNDDLERTERAISSSLADTEAKYSKALEEKILMEQELMLKAHVEEEAQRLRDELRDANSEIQVLRDQLDNFKTIHNRNSLMTPPATDSSCSPRHDNSSTTNLPGTSNDDQLLDTVAPADVLLADDLNVGAPARPSRKSSLAPSDKPRIVFPKPSFAARASTGLHSRSNSLRASPGKPTTTLPGGRSPRISTASRSSANSNASKSKGVQMVSEMRARVRNLEQKLHTRVPRLRSGTFDRGSLPRNSPNMAAKKPIAPESPGWVLVMEDSPPPRRVPPRRPSNSPPPTAFPMKTPSVSGDDSPVSSTRSIGRSFAKGRTSIPTPTTSRPGSPDFYKSPTETRTVNALKRTSVPMFPAGGRMSLGSSTDSREGSLSLSQRSTNTVRGSMAPPPLPTPRQFAASTMGNPSLKRSTNNPLSASIGTSRIGRPMSFSSRRTDTGPSTKSLPVDEYGMVINTTRKSGRSGSVSQFGGQGETF